MTTSAATEHRRGPRVERKIFGTDGVRGEANTYPMTTEIAMAIGRAIVKVIGRGGHHSRVVIGKDTRLSGYMLESALVSGIASAGGDVYLVGPLPTPGIAHMTQAMRADAGVVISASHNPYADNGIKIFGRDGYKLPDEVESELESIVFGDGGLASLPTSADLGKAFRIQDALGRYVTFVKSTFPRELRLDGLRIVVDCAHGAAYRAGPLVLEELGGEVRTLGVKPNGKNINLNCGALHPAQLAREVKSARADIGIALDGDADRLIVVDEHGHVVDGDAIMALVGARRLADHSLRKKTLVATVMSNLGLERAIERAGGKLVRTAVGDRYVVEAMRRHGYNIGGEQSGHLVFLDYTTTGDGLIAALQVLAVMVRESRSISELAAEAMERVPQLLVNLKVAHKRPLDELPEVDRAIKAAEKKLGNEGRVVVRFSGTEPKVRIMIEGPDEAQIKSHADSIAAALQSALG
ncbi:MAG: phosphoglucosamine mutase [Deltaproteobacteria bacterium]|nr:phosphoglucosamine mutase [Deltaproteobacteria bacterium]